MSSWTALLLDLSGKMTFGVIGLWILLRWGALIEKEWGFKKPLFFPISAQRLGFAQGLGSLSVIESEEEYAAKKKERSWLQQWAKTWWPLITGGALIQFMILFGAKGLAHELEVPFGLGLSLSISAFLTLFLFRKNMIFDHLKETGLEEGKELDWDDEWVMGGIRLRLRLQNRPKKVSIQRKESDVIMKDKSTFIKYRGIQACPDSVHQHGSGLISSEFRMLDKKGEELTLENWRDKVKLKDVLTAIGSAYVASNHFQKKTVALLEYPDAVLLVSPLAEHVEFVEAVGERLRNRKKLHLMNMNEIASSAAQEFPSRFTEEKVAELMAHHAWISQEVMKV